MASSPLPMYNRAINNERASMRLRLKVKEFAEVRGYNQSSLARRADVDFKTVKRLFRDPYRDVAVSTIYKISRVLRVPLDDLIEEVSDDHQ